MANDNSKNLILQKALTLFCAHGYDGTGIQDITAAAGVTKPTLYYFFGNKDGLFEAVWETYFPILENPLIPCCRYENHIADYESDVYGQLRRIVAQFFDFIKNQQEFYRLMMEAVYAPPESKALSLSTGYFNRLYGLLEQFFTGASEAHGTMKGKEHEFAISFLAQINAYAGIWLALPEGSPQRPLLDDSCAHTLVKQFMHGIFS